MTPSNGLLRGPIPHPFSRILFSAAEEISYPKILPEGWNDNGRDKTNKTNRKIACERFPTSVRYYYYLS